MTNIVLIIYLNIMKITFLLFTLTLFLSSNTICKKSNSYQTECVSLDADGYVTILIWNTKKGAKYKPEQARKDAIHSILFSGISGGNGCMTQPPILNKLEEQENFKSVKRIFFSKKGKWSMFTSSSTKETTLPTNLGVKNWKVYQVSISKNELRNYLEEQKIIKSLTNGF